MASLVFIGGAARDQDRLMQRSLEMLVLAVRVPGCSLPFPHLHGLEADVVDLLLRRDAEHVSTLESACEQGRQPAKERRRRWR